MAKRLSVQQVFNRVAAHLLKQGEQSVDSTGDCAYRGAGGLKCAAGCLIPNRAYRASLEGGSVERSDVRRALRSAGVYADAIPMLLELQQVHDGFDPSDWRSELALIAKGFHLKSPKPLAA